jgi:hypothetical protein
VGKTSPIPKADVAFSNKKKHMARASQKATELTSSSYQSALQETTKKKKGILKHTLEV